MPNFSKLELQNFKSYRELVCIEWKQLNAVIGLNGVGKSSLVDAIEFVFCFPKYNKKSVRYIRDNVCNRSAELYDYSSTWVKITLNVDGKETIFQRIADYRKSVHKYLVNGVEQPSAEYRKRLLDFNINYKANNFLVQQDAVESIALKSAKERGEFFEHISNSIAYKGEYIRLNDKLTQINADTKKLKEDLEFHLKQKDKLIKSSKLVQRYEKLQVELNKAEHDYSFAKLYQIDKMIQDLDEKQNDLKLHRKVAQKLLKSTESSVKKLKKQLEDEKNSLQKLDEELNVEQTKFSKHALKMSTLAQKISHCKATIEKVEENLKNAVKLDEARERTISDLERQYREIVEAKENYIETHQSQSQTHSLTLGDEQHKEYLKLKQQVQQRCTEELGFFDSIERERDSIKDELANHKRVKELLSEEIKRKRQQFEKLNSDLESIDKKVEETKLIELNTQQEKNQLQIEIENLKAERTRLNSNIDNLSRQIDEMKCTKEEDKKFERKQEILNRLKSYFTGVRDRLKNLCDISEERYQVAIMKIMGNKMDNIVVNDMSTALKCIRFLKEQYRGAKFSAVEIFLPLDSITTTSANSVLKAIEGKPNAILALNVMDVPSEEIRHIVHYALGNVVICKTDDEAFDLCRRKKINCVSLNGTYFKKDGIYSGGLATLLQKSRNWNIKERENLKEEKQKNISSLREVEKQIRTKEEEKRTLEWKLSGLKQRLEKHLERLLKEQRYKCESAAKDLEDLEKRLNALKTDPKIETLRKKLDEQNQELERIEIKRNKIEDEIFTDFCKDFHIDNIRQYEHGDFKTHKEYLDRKKEFDDHLNKILNQIEYEKHRDTKTSIEKLQNQLQVLKKNYETLKVEENTLKEFSNTDHSSNKKKVKLENIKKKITEIEKDLKLEELKFKSNKADLKKYNLSISGTESKIEALQAEKHKLLVDCKVNNINIPLRRGTIDKVVLKQRTYETVTESSNSTEESSNNSQLKEGDMEIDYSKLPNSISNLGEDGLNNYIEHLKNKIESLCEELLNMQPDYMSKKNFKLIEEKEKSLKNDYKKKLEELYLTKKELDEVNHQRYDKFNNFFNAVAEKIDKIFKDLYKHAAAQAEITIKNAENPYLDGIEFSCVIPGKKFIRIERLSGGEKTMCGIALLLAIYSVKPAPFLIFDEIDAALDNKSIRKINNYFSQLKSSMQIIIISHHELLASCAEAVIGVNIQLHTNSSYVVHADLSHYQKKTTAENCLSINRNERLQSFANRILES